MHGFKLLETMQTRQVTNSSYQTTDFPLFNALPQRVDLPDVDNSPHNLPAPSENNIPIVKSNEESISLLLNHFFPHYQPNDKIVLKIRNILKKIIDQYSFDELKIILTEVQYMCESLLNEYEQKTFKGKTLNELFINKS